MPQEPTISSKQIYEGRALALRVDTVKKPGGRETTREIVEHQDCVAIVAIDGEDNVLLVRQFRKAVEEVLLEIPAGGIEHMEEPIQTVRRELQEETGYYPHRVEPLGIFYSAPGYCTEQLYLYLATELKPNRLVAEDTDEIEVIRFPVSQVQALIGSGAIHDAKSIAGLLTYLLKYHPVN